MDAKWVLSSLLHFAPVIGAALILLLPSIGSSATVAVIGVSEIRTSTGTTLNDGSLVWVGTFGAKTDATIQSYFSATSTLANLQSNFSIFATGQIYKSSVFSFTPTSTSVAQLTATVSGGKVTSITVNSGGAGYNADTTTVNLLGGGGSGASAELVIEDKIIGEETVKGVITRVRILENGSDYNSAPTVVLSSEEASLVYTAESTLIFGNQNIYALVFNAATAGTSDQVALFRSFDAGGGTYKTFPNDNVLSSDLELSTDSLGAEILFGTTYSTTGDGQFRMGSLSQAASITSSLTAEATRESPFSYTIKANNGPTSFDATYNGGALPTGLSIDSTTGVIDGTPTASAGTYNIQLTSIGPLGSVTATLVLEIKNPVVTDPVITSPTTDQTAVAGGTYAGYTITARNSPTSYSIEGGPAGLSCNSSTGEISGYPTQVGSFTIVIKATNTSGTGSSSFRLVVSAPTVVFADKTFTPNISDSTTPPIVTSGFTPKYSILEGELFAGLTLDSFTGVISGTPTAYGTKKFTIRATGEGGYSVNSNQFTLGVTTTPPTLNSATTVTGYTAGSSKDRDIIYTLSTVNDPAVAPVDYYTIVSTSDSSLFDVAKNFTPSSGVLKFSTQKSGIYTVKFRAYNGITAGTIGGGLSQILEVTFTIEVPQPTFVNQNSLAKYVTINNKDYVSIPISNGRVFEHNQLDATTGFFSALPGYPWPNSITRKGSAEKEQITFRPTQVGTYGIRKSISNISRIGATQAATRDVIITVVDQPPTVAGSGFVTPPAGKVGQAYRAYITRSGRDRNPADPISFNATGLPKGLSFVTGADRQMGLLTGTPAEGSQGTYSVKFYIANPKGYITQNATMVIEKP